MVDSNNIDVIRQNIRELAKTQDPTVISGLITNVEANTDAIGDINALVGSTPLPAGESTITHAIDTLFSGGGGGGGVNYSTTEQDTGKKWINGETVYQRTFTGTVASGQISDIIEATGITIIDTECFVYGTTGLGLSLGGIPSAGQWITALHVRDDNGTKKLALMPSTEMYGGTYYVTIKYIKNTEE